MRKKVLYLLLIIISIIALTISLNSRVQIERAAKSIEINLDYYETDLMAKQSDNDLSWWLKKFKGYGAYGVALEEESLKTLVRDNKPINYYLASDVIADIHKDEKFADSIIRMIDAGSIDKYDIIVETKDKQMDEFILKGLKERYKSSLYKHVSGETSYFILDGNIKDAYYAPLEVGVDYQEKRIALPERIVGSKLENIGLGFDQEKIDAVKESGLNLLLRPRNFVDDPSKLIEVFGDVLDKNNVELTSLITIGDSILGFDASVDQTEKLYEFMKERKIPMGLIETTVQRENIEQAGINDMVRYLDYSAVRTFSLIEYLQMRYQFYNYDGAEEIENTMYRAITERNIRNIYFRPFLKDHRIYVTDAEEYEKTFAGLAERMTEHNMVYGKSSVMSPNRVNMLNSGLIGLGLLAFGVLLLKLIFRINEKIELGLLGLGIVGIFPALFVAPNMATMLLALSASIILPSLAAVMLLEFCKIKLTDSKVYRTRDTLLNGAVILVIGVLTSMLGGLYVGGLLSGSEYMLEMNIFRGVKLSQLAPMLVYVLAYVIGYGYKREKGVSDSEVNYFEDIFRLLNENIKIIYVIVGFAALVVGYIYIARTGHETNIQPSNLEMIFRNFLEVKLLARPRNKEFLMAFPGIILMVYLACKKYRWAIFPLGLTSLIGFTSVANTFSHLRTPLYLSITRTVYSGLFGLILGIIGTLIVHMIISFVNTLRGRTKHE